MRRHVELTPNALGETFHETGIVIWFQVKSGVDKSKPAQAPKDMRRPGDKAPILRGMVVKVDSRNGTFRGENDHGIGGEFKVEDCLFLVDSL